MAGIKHELNNRVSGNPQQCLDRIKEFEELGMTRFGPREPAVELAHRGLQERLTQQLQAFVRAGFDQAGQQQAIDQAFAAAVASQLKQSLRVAVA